MEIIGSQFKLPLPKPDVPHEVSTDKIKAIQEGKPIKYGYFCDGTFGNWNREITGPYPYVEYNITPTEQKCHVSSKGYFPDGNVPMGRERTTTLVNIDDSVTIMKNSVAKGRYHDLQRFDAETGLYSLTVFDGKKTIEGRGYEVNLTSSGRNFANGFKGKLQKVAMRIATDANGCERPVLRGVGEFLFKIAGKIR